MAIDQTPSPSTSEPLQKPAIENEFPTYRAISSMAVFSLILGLLAVFSFANLGFLAITAASTLTGWLAIRKIRKYPDVLTGESIAGFGIGVGLLLGLSATTNQVVQHITTSMEAKKFAEYFIRVIKKGDVNLCLWEEQSYDYRKQSSVEKAVDELKKAKSPSTTDLYASKIAPYNAVIDRLKSPGQDIHYSNIEQRDFSGLTTYANVLLEIDGPATKEYPNKDYALLMLLRAPNVSKNEWVVKEFRYPYKPASVSLEVQPVDDGHGHAGGH